MFVDGELLGVCEALNKNKGDFTEDDQHVLENLAALAATTIANARVSEDNRNFFSHMLEIITQAIEGVDTRLTGHSYRTAELACMIGRQMGIQGEEYKTLYLSSLLHDIGMLAIHNLKYLPNVVNQTIERTPDKLHPLIGAELVKDIKLLARIAPIIRHHHEYMDGSGHPDGLVGDDIPMASRIICVAEAIDELRMAGFVGESLNERATKLVWEGAGTKFDKVVVDAYLAASA
jgi:HD-GYP domain-containing protein (c-di-GMP phosphodiesterase class II)